jgi:hypothetical protein
MMTEHTIIIKQSSNSLDVWIGILGVFVGFIGSVTVELVRGRITTNQKRTERQENQRNASNLHQLDMLKELQEKSSDLLRNYHKAIHQDIMASKKGVAWGSNALDAQLDEELSSLHRRLIILKSRIKDAQVRKYANNFVNTLSTYVQAKDKDSARQILNSAIVIFDKELNNRCGVLIRGIHTDS